MIIHMFGGIYADIDTECRSPISTWVQHGCRVVIATENDAHFCNWAFAAEARHPLLESAVNVAMGRMIAGNFNVHDENFVHAVTGPGAFTRGVLDFLQLAEHPGNLTEYVVAHRQALRAAGVCLWTHDEFETVLGNLYSSQKASLQSATWQSWTRQHNSLMKLGA